MSVSFDPTGPGATRSFEVHNESLEESIAVEFSVTTREMDEVGKETQAKPPGIEKWFLIYPPQLILKPKERRTIRVSWRGTGSKALVKQELAFRLIAEQLPVKTELKVTPKGANIRMLLKYVAAIYVSPEGAQPHLTLKDSEVLRGATPQLKLTFQNSGTAHQVLVGPSLKIATKQSHKNLELPSAELGTLAGQNILAGKTRSFTLPWPKALPVEPLEVDFELSRP